MVLRQRLLVPAAVREGWFPSTRSWRLRRSRKVATASRFSPSVSWVTAAGMVVASAVLVATNGGRSSALTGCGARGAASASGGRDAGASSALDRRFALVATNG